MEKNFELSENMLEKVSGGAAGREKSLTVELDLTMRIWADDIVIMVYVDGELDSSKTVTVDGSVSSKKFTFNGTRGIKNVRFKINNDYIVMYTLNFDTMTVTEA